MRKKKNKQSIPLKFFNEIFVEMDENLCHLRSQWNLHISFGDLNDVGLRQEFTT